jgi:ADP-ribose pyrophosphatase
MTEYMKRLRQLVGHEHVMQCGASVILVNDKNEMLLQKRRDNGCWGYAGGSVELSENTEITARRELFEETGLTAGKLELYGVFSGENQHYIYPNGDEVSNIDIVYVCREYSGELRCQASEVLELRFFALDSLPENLSPPVADIILKFAGDF